MIKTQIQSLEDQIEDIDNNPPVLVPVPVPVPVPVMNSTRPKIIDKNGVVVGEYIGPQDKSVYLTILEINNIKYVLEVRNEYLRGTEVFFANNDCTGQAYVREDSNFMVMPVGVAPLNANVDPDNETFYEVDINNLVNKTFNSFWNPNDHICDVSTDTRDFFTATPVFDLSTLYLPPYTLDIN